MRDSARRAVPDIGIYTTTACGYCHAAYQELTQALHAGDLRPARPWAA